MSTADFLSIPIELVHRICDHLDFKTIFCSFRCVCKQLQKAIVTYNKFELDFTPISKSNLELVSYIIRPENIISLIISNNYKGKLHKFFSVYDIHNFTRLRSLTLGQIEHGDLDRFLQHINISTLVSLSVKLRESNKTKAVATISSVINRCHLEKLCLSNFDQVVKDILWPVQYTLQHLTIGVCTFEEFHFILHHLSHLRTFVLKECKTNSLIRTNYVPFADTSYPKLTSLTIEDCPYDVDHLKLILSLTPSLVHLKLSTNIWSSYLLLDGSFWAEFIQTKLPLLDKFDFVFAGPFHLWFATRDARALLLSFKTPFWLDEKHWFVTCDHYITSASQHRIVMYTLPTYTRKESGILIRHKAISIDDVHLLNQHCINGIVTTDDVIIALNLNGKHVGHQVIQYLGIALRNNTTLITLHLGGNYIGDNGIQYLSEALQNNTALTSLHLGNNQIGETGIQSLTDMLRNKPLTTLDLKSNRLAARGAQHLADLLRNNATIITLDVKENQILDEGTRYLADALQNNTTLTILNLQNNHITSTGIQYLTDTLRNNKTLMILYLGENQIDDEGAQYLADMLKNNTILITLDLKNNVITARGAEYLADALQTNTTLTTLNLEINNISTEGIQHLSDNLRANLILTTSNLEDNIIGGDIM